MNLETELSREDALRLHVLLADELHAVRIDEGTMTLHALTPKGEARVGLHRNCRAELYLMRVRELLGGHALGSPSGYPVHLRQWTRMGQANTKNLEALLKLGQPEAVVAVAQAPTLNEELARRVWWSQPTMDVARYMLGHATVCEGVMGKVLAEFVIEHLAFEEDPIQAMNSVRAVLGAGVLDATARTQLWAKARRRPHYFIGFLEHHPDDLPAEQTRAIPAYVAAHIAARLAVDDPWARSFSRCYSASGQSFLHAAELALEKPPAHEAVSLLLDILGGYFAAVRGLTIPPDFDADLKRAAAAMSTLATISNADATQILSKTTAVGALMRRHLEPLFQPLLAHIRLLRGAK